jgi:hypothetical protein
MTDSLKLPPVKSLHPDSSLKAEKLAKMEKLSTEIRTSLLAGEHCLKTRPDGTILERHHRLYVLRRRGIEVDNLPREVIVKDEE